MSLEKLAVQSYIVYKPEFLRPLEQISNTVTLERRGQMEGTDKWALYKAGSVVYKSTKEFDYENMPSSRTSEILSDTRFETAQEALNFWETEMKENFEKELKDFQALCRNVNIKHI